MKPQNILVLGALVLGITTLIGNPVHAEDASKPSVDLHLGTGVKIIPSVMWGFIPAPVTRATTKR